MAWADGGQGIWGLKIRRVVPPPVSGERLGGYPRLPTPVAGGTGAVPEASVVMAQCPITVSPEYTVCYSS